MRAATQRMLAEAQAAGKAKGTIKEKQEGPDPRQALQGSIGHQCCFVLVPKQQGWLRAAVMCAATAQVCVAAICSFCRV